MKNTELLSFASDDELAARAAGAWLDEIESANRAGKTHCVALSGGRIVQKFFAASVEQTEKRAISFGRVRFFWADERCVPPTDPESNFKPANELLFAPLEIPAVQIHRIRGEDSPQAAAKIAEEELRRIVSANKNRQPVLDLVFLGMGEDGHIASLFPGTTGLAAALDPDGARLAIGVELAGLAPYVPRISLTGRALLDAKLIVLLTGGAPKRVLIERALTDPAFSAPVSALLRQTRAPVRLLWSPT